MPLRILIDLQGAQTGSRLRGIGRYSLALTRAIARNAGEDLIFVLLSNQLPETIEAIRETLEDVLGENRFLIFNAQGPVSAIPRENERRRRVAEILREYMIDLLSPDAVLVTSMIEGIHENAVTSIGDFVSTIPTAVILYDLIPLFDANIFASEDANRWYHEKLDYFRRAGCLFAISQSSMDDAVKMLGVDRTRVKNISAASDSYFSSQDVSSDDISLVKQKYAILRKYLMHSSNFEPRKNFQGLIRAYARLPAAVRREHQLVLVCNLTPSISNELTCLATDVGLAAGELVLTGFVPDNELVALYAGCDLFVFPSFQEGFGLPALEAMSCGVPTIGSNATSVPEVIGRADALFDPTSPEAMAAMMFKALTDENFSRSLRSHAKVQAAKFSWDETALRVIAGLRELVARQETCGPKEAIARKRRRMLERVAAIVSEAQPNDLDLLDLASTIESNHIAVKQLNNAIIETGS
jgi:glycosyltransferase involved in cell wall biosynthesis